MTDPVIIGRVVSVNVGLIQTVEWFGRQVQTAIWKAPVEGPVAVAGVNLAGDDQADRRVHGGHDKAVYAYAIEDYRWWSSELGMPFPAGTFGENLTTEGVDLAWAVIGERWRIGSAILEVSQPRMPCFKLGLRMGDSAFVDRFDEAGRSGSYLRIVDAGTVTAGDEISRVAQPDYPLTIGDLVEAQRRPTSDLLMRIAASEDVPPGWRNMAERALARL